MRDQITVRRTFYPVKQFVSWFSQKQIELRPPFQRKDVWKPKSKSFLIDTIFQGLPLPIIILRDKAGIALEPSMEVVDGQQRLTTLLAFILPERFPQRAQFVISRAHSSEFAGKSFYELPDEARRRILDYELSVHILPSSVDDQEVLRIFSRLNATGVGLNDQELRNAQFQGVFKIFALEISIKHLTHWQKFNLFNEDDLARMQETKFSSELIQRILKGSSPGSKSSLDKLYKDFDDEFRDAEEVERRFDLILQEIDRVFASNLADTYFERTTWFYTLFGVVHDNIFGKERSADEPYLRRTDEKRLPKEFWPRISRFADYIRVSENLPGEVVEAITGRTTNIKTRLARESFLIRHISQIE